MGSSIGFYILVLFHIIVLYYTVGFIYVYIQFNSSYMEFLSL